MDLSNISGIGDVRKKALENSGIFSAEDLVNYFPYKYYDFSKTEPFCFDGKFRLIRAKVCENAKIFRARAGLSVVSCKMTDEIGQNFLAVWYNQTYVLNNLEIGGEYYLYGKNSPTKKNNFIVMISKQTSKQKLGYLPVYHTISGIGQKVLHDSIMYSLKAVEICSLIPLEIEKRYNLMPLLEAYLEVHNPSSEDLANLAFERIEIENLISLIAINEYNKFNTKIEKLHCYKNIFYTLEEYIKLLPYDLTFDQKNAINDIEKDLSSKFSMNRLLQGDVGSGKTAVAFFGAYLSAKNGFQSIISAPTEILARQHFEFAKKIFERENIEIVLLTSSLSSLEKRIILAKIETGEAKIIIGTHSVFSESVMYKNLTYIVVDEQHRFGVEQRKKLSEKGKNPDILVMSATPIPRSMNLVVYGDLELSVIASRPKPFSVCTNIVTKQKQEDMWSYISGKIAEDSRIYVVCAKIDEENEDDSVKDFSAKNMYEFLKEKFGEELVGLMHGKLSREKQGEIFENFKAGKIKILVSTTIVEVGVDIPEADIMIIATPEKFGLATLHQLRGRVGRNGKKAYCFCLANNLNESSYERILFFKNHTNGFEISEYDLKTRGAGSIIGTNQHGQDNGLFSRFSSEIYSTAKQILEQLKPNIVLYSKILESGNALYNAKILGKVILN